MTNTKEYAQLWRAKVLKSKGVDAELIIYPGVGRGFDFRPAHVRTFADDLATKDVNQRTASFIKKHLIP